MKYLTLIFSLLTFLEDHNVPKVNNQIDLEGKKIFGRAKCIKKYGKQQSPGSDGLTAEFYNFFLKKRSFYCSFNKPFVRKR